MEKIAVSQFKATCLALVERVRKTRQPVLITRFGRPVAQLIPAELESVRSPATGLGCMAGTGRITGDII
jgi:prevent-host-death family protein